MMKYIYKPNLPEGKVKKIICGTDDEAILSFFKEKGISVLRNAPNCDIDIAVSTHADMAANYLGDGKVITDKAQELLIDALENQGFSVIKASGDIKGNYPGDVGLNVALTSDYAIGNFSYADAVLVEHIGAKKQINVKQGYCKCSVLIIDDYAVISDDAAICEKLQKNGFDVLFIEKGDIHLDGHPYGFIGGASGKISKDTVVFFGDVKAHRDFEKIRDFLLKHGCDYICTDSGPLRDIGGFVSLCEE